MSTQHTPGPWYHPPEGSQGATRTTVWSGNGDIQIAECKSRGLSLSGNRANARLIAAAPELLESGIESASAIQDAYEAIYQSLPDGPVPAWFVRLEHAAKQARAAITKAGGAQ